MGPGKNASQKDCVHAFELGKLVAQHGWTLLTGGRNVGLMDAASRGAHEAGGLVIGILPSKNKKEASEFIDIPICTGIGSARNNINVLSSDVVIACGSGAGTISEIMLSLKARKPLILLNPKKSLIDLQDDLPYPNPEIKTVPSEAAHFIKNII